MVKDVIPWSAQESSLMVSRLSAWFTVTEDVTGFRAVDFTFIKILTSETNI